MILQTILGIATVHLLSVSSPGPDFAVVTKNTLSSGIKSGIGTAFGITLANILFLILVLSGFTLILQSNPTIFKLLTCVGAIYLYYIGYKCIKSEGVADFATPSVNNISFQSSFSIGFFTSISNPKAFFYFAGILSQFITPKMNLNEKLIILLVVVAISALWFN